MKWIGDRVSYKNHENFFTMIITPKKEGWKIWAMIVWLIAWIFCGVVVIYSLFFNEDIIDSKLYFSTFLLFWAYFLYKIFRVLLWRKYGTEFIKVDQDRFTIKKSIWSFGKAREFLLNNIDKLDLESLKESSYAKVFNDSFWVVGQGTIIIKALEKNNNFGAQISIKEGKEIIKVLKKQIKNFQSIT